MAFGATEVYQAAFGKQINADAAGEIIAVHLRLDVHLGDALRVVEPVHLNLVVEMADVTHNGLVLHLEDVLQRDDVAVTRGRDVNVRLAQRVFDRRDFEPFHRGLEGVDGIDFGDDHAGAEAAQRMGGAFANVSVAAHDGYFTPPARPRPTGARWLGG